METFPLQTSKMHAAQYEAGGPEKLYIGEVSIPEPNDREVLIKVYMSAINRADTLQRRGLYPAPAGQSPILGLEASGVIERVAPGVTKWKVGDRVMALLSGGGNAEFATVHEDHAIALPVDMTWRDAASIPEVWLTAYQLLHLVGDVQKGNYVLIHAGGSGVGTAAVQLSLLAGAIPIVTAGSQAKIDLAKGLGAFNGFNYKEGDFDKKVMEATEGHGADVILDCVGGSFWTQNIECAAVDAKWILYGTLGGGEVNGPILSKLLRKRVQLKASTLRARSIPYKAELISAFAKNALPHFSSGKLKPVIHTVLPIDQLSNAHALMESNENAGKILIEVVKDSAHQEL